MRFIDRLPLWLLWAAMPFCLAACHPSSRSETPSSVTAAPLDEKTTGWIEIEDGLGRRVKVPQPVQRVISLAPACTETLFAVGAAEQVVAVTSFDNYPPEVAGRTRIGGFSRETISIETIVGLQPDVIFSSGSLQVDLIEDLENLGLTVVALEPQTYDGVMDAVRLAGIITGHSSRAEEIAATLQREGDEVRRVIDAIPRNERPRVYYEVWDNPMRTAGSSSFLGHLVELAGGRNIFDDLDSAYPLVSEELVLHRDPQVILAPANPNVAADAIAVRRGWGTVTAVRDGRIFRLDEDLVSRPGPRIGQALQTIARALYPERFPALSTHSDE
jgi:iron complex transport system substrate-binding protein